jgi:hypothetical protein
MQPKAERTKIAGPLISAREKITFTLSLWERRKRRNNLVGNVTATDAG